MIPYRRRVAIEKWGNTLVASDVTVGDVILIRRPGEIERTPEKVTGVEFVPGTDRFRMYFENMEPREVSRDIPVRIFQFTDLDWRQYVPFEVRERWAK